MTAMRENRSRSVKAVILAGGQGSRLAEETEARPKPMVEIGGRPILWHIMKMYGVHGINEFIICLGYRGYMIKEYFSNYFLHMSDVTFDMNENRMEVHRGNAEPWRVTLIDTGEASMTGGRLRRVLPYVVNDPYFVMTYGDGVSDIDISAELAFHEAHGRDATVAVVRPTGRFGAIALDGQRVTGFREKPEAEGSWINGGFFVLSPRVGSLLTDDTTVWEREPMETLAATDQLRAFEHRGYWQPMDTLRDKIALENEWSSGSPRWRRW